MYTGTHDNNTTRGWLASLSEVERAYLTSYMGKDRPQTSQELIRLALSSTANTVIVPLQDVLDLGSEARVNRPGAREGNWSWRVLSEQLDPGAAGFLADMTSTYGRGL